MRLRGALLAAAAAASVAACSGSVPYGRDSSMVPLPDAVEGCKAYRLVVKGGYAPAVVYFRRADGTFTKDRREAACPRPPGPE